VSRILLVLSRTERPTVPEVEISSPVKPPKRLLLASSVVLGEVVMASVAAISAYIEVQMNGKRVAGVHQLGVRERKHCHAIPKHAERRVVDHPRYFLANVQLIRQW